MFVSLPRRLDQWLPRPVPGARPTRGLMLEVMLALVPGLLLKLFELGPVPVLSVLTGITSALLFEGLFLGLRHTAVWRSLGDGSAALTGALIGLSVSPLAPWWVITLASGFGIIFGKQLYGGVGHNPFNPAMVGYAAVLISFPNLTSIWPLAINQWPNDWGLVAAVKGFFQGISPQQFDAIVGATPLGRQHDLLQGLDSVRIKGPMLFLENIGFLLGGCFLIYRRAIDLRITLGLLLSLFAGAFLLREGFGIGTLSPLQELFAGSTMLAAFFIATDPVSAPITPIGRWLHGAGIGGLTLLIRVLGSYPDGTAFAVLMMNFIAPTLDHFSSRHRAL